MDIREKLCKEFPVKPDHMENIISLIDDGNTIPFIARYRKEMHGSCDDQLLREIADRLQYLRNLEKKKEDYIAHIEELGKMTEELRADILAAETLAVLILALTILIFTLKGKDRLCYILYGAWIAYFVLDQVFELPSTILNLLFPPQMPPENIFFIANIGHVFNILSMCGIITIGCLLAEYMNDGTIYNRAFNIISFFTVLLLLVNISTSCIIVIKDRFYELLFITFNNLYRLAMVFLFVFFAYDSAKKQLSKVNFDK